MIPTRDNARPRSRRPLLMLALLVMAALGGVAALLAWKSSAPVSGRREVQETRPVAVAGTPLPRFPDGATFLSDPARGLPFPELRGAAFDGTPVTITADGKGKVVVFLAHWCPHCQAEVPRLTAWLRSGGLPPGVALYSVSTAAEPSRPNFPPSQWLAREGWTAPVIADDRRGTAAEAAGLSAFPFFVFVGADGKVAGRQSGELSVDSLKGIVATLPRS